MSEYEALDYVVCRASEGDLDLICSECGERICTVEHGDTLGVLARTANSHREDAGHLA